MDKFLDELGEKIADNAKDEGHQEIYDSHEQRSYQNYAETAKEAGLVPESYNALKKHYKPFNSYRKALERVKLESA